MTGASPGGVLPVDKPAGPTSHDVVDRARRALGTRRIGHTGTLDPFASGLLLLGVGPATRLSEYLTGLEKTYDAAARLGVRTTTDDPEGDVMAASEAWREVDAAALEAALAGLRGPIRQVPPVYSAKKVEGQAAHRRVRKGEAVSLEAVEVEVKELVTTSLELPLVHLRVRCSSGTYVRALARDLGEALGTGAHLTALRRTAVGPFEVESAVHADRLDDREAVEAAWRPPAEALAFLPTVEVGEEGARRLAHGGSVPLDDLEGPEAGERPGAPAVPGGVPLAVVRGGELVAVAELRGRAIHPRKVFASPAGDG